MPKNNSKPQREHRQKGAAERQAKRDARTPQQQLALLDNVVGSAARERARLA